ncbi:LCP family protein [Protaetiibacter intestinalis]|uniref:LytR family transcriptional regulator n=1 Tax=Protaetiibacter intestinalis TaxID=2419774 RepID=A0A387B6T6_9MICO|nr:LCP family protein [Protaetiibacter intestinalis]AYF99484.1 LytR family transcriptional regulator [Protaetiibacter intestinalis]
MSEQEQLRDRSQRARAPRPTGIARHGRLPRSRAWKTVLGLIGSTVAVVLVATTSVGAIAIMQLKQELDDTGVTINETEAPIPEIGAYEGGFNVLVVGSDAYYDRDSVLNDVNILVHVSADQTSAVAVSFPRDMVVPFPPCTNEETGRKTSAASGIPINSALSYGGLNCVVDVVRNFTGLEIQYAAMIGFEGVANMATAVGGVDVCVQGEIHDKYVGLDLEAGTHHLDGWQALQFVRSRHGVGDGSDLTRISSQQVFMSALLRKLKSEDTLTNVGKLWGIANAALENMKLSKELTQVPTMIAMAKALSNIPMDRITFVQYPGSTGGTGIYAGKVQPNKTLGTQLIDAIKADQAIAVEAGDGRGSELDPNATQEPTAPETSTPDPTGSATPTPEQTLSEAVTINGLRGQTAADQTCTIGN